LQVYNTEKNPPTGLLMGTEASVENIQKAITLLNDMDINGGTVNELIPGTLIFNGGIFAILCSTIRHQFERQQNEALGN